VWAYGNGDGRQNPIAWTYDEGAQKLAFTCTERPWWKSEGFVSSKILSLMRRYEEANSRMGVAGAGVRRGRVDGELPAYAQQPLPSGTYYSPETNLETQDAAALGSAHKTSAWRLLA